MIIRRNRGPQTGVVRRIVRRTRPAVGEARPRTIVRRSQFSIGEGVVAPRACPRWRPGRRLLVLAASFALLAGLVVGGIWVYRAPYFRVSTVEVVGTQRMSPGTVVSRAGILGESMLTADLAAVQRSIYELPLVAAVRVERDWPSTIRIVIEERRPWGTWEQAGVDYLIDREGVVLAVGERLEPGAPAIRSSEPGTRLVGDRVDYQAVDAAAEIYERLPRQLGTTVAEVAFIKGKGVQVTTADGQIALFGDSSSIAYKLAVWAALAAEARQRHIAYTIVDLRYGNRPVLQ
ncbi:cell division protein FtsQ/DivIB [Tepidiforma bonchosmolovskayae]|jgi:cell division protein FtsQ|uniref:Cell division protein FtsQ n=1 Tax=Tepidiforma bonchosmolovskayae TaxID=2601677 RepID=A0ABX6BYQ0_9CHLR|nr:FtsQ-type POTRA domain-containing protein [Tepidiforma bonchosmolovskayae]QFG02102.1 FtsQ-type POTRA domain-containing protein [Tepidiforma bonchosmolovskayae]